MVDQVHTGVAADAKPKPAREVKLRVTYNGVEVRLEVRDDMVISDLRALAITKFSVTEPQHLLGLFGTDGLELVDTQTIAEAGLKNNARLLLRQSIVRGG